MAIWSNTSGSKSLNFVPNSFAQLAALEPDVLIMDIVVGQQAGWEFLERLNADATTSGIPVLVVSTDHTLLERAREQAARYGENRYLIKPFGVEEILEHISASVFLSFHRVDRQFERIGVLVR